MSRNSDAHRLSEIRNDIWDLLVEAGEIAEKYNNTPVTMAVNYWLPHMKSSIGDGSFNMGTMLDSIKEIRNGDDEQ